VGVMGNPAKASREIGEAITREVVGNLSEFIRKLDQR